MNQSNKTPTNSIKYSKRLRVALPIILLVLIFIIFLIAYSRDDGKIDEQTSTDLSSLDSAKRDIALREQMMHSEDRNAEIEDYLFVGNSYRDDGDFDTAKNFYERAEAENSESAEVLFALANINRLMENQTEALRYYERLISVVSDADHPFHDNLRIYEAELSAVREGDLGFDNLEDGYDDNVEQICC